jgi:uncharacterized protein YdhG (YjbR/CyaY superfamily)
LNKVLNDILVGRFCGKNLSFAYQANTINLNTKSTAMKPDKKTTESIDAYINLYPEEVQVILNKIRATIQKAAPEAEETIKYGIPTFTLNGNLVHFGAFKNHIGFYPAPSGMQAFKNELAVYEKGKGSIQFPLSQPIPYKLVEDIVQFRVNANLGKATQKIKKKK